LEPAIVQHDGARLVIDESIGPGIIAESADGSVTVDNTLAARLRRGEAELAIELARRLREPAAAVGGASRDAGR
jgi:vacuolar-type H+-ATPase subunit E/Vma4